MTFRKRALLRLLPAVLVGCGPVLDVEQGTDSDSTTTMSSTAGPTSSTTTQPVTTAGPTTVTSFTTDGPDTTSGCFDGCPPDVGQVICPDNPAFDCSGPIDCGPGQCGGIMSQFDENGCLRFACQGDIDCPAGQVCFTPMDWGGCVGSATSCSEDGGTCGCGGTADCGGSYCVPADAAPPTQCGNLETEQACLDAGCSSWTIGRPLEASGDSCLCDLDEGHCLWNEHGGLGIPGPEGYVRLSDFRVVVFPTDFDIAPLGWVKCSDLQAPPEACACARVLPCAMGG